MVMVVIAYRIMELEGRKLLRSGYAISLAACLACNKTEQRVPVASAETRVVREWAK